MYNSNLGKSYGLEDHHIFPQSVLYKNGYKKKESKDRKIVNDIANRAFLTDIKFYARLGNTTQPMNPKEMTQYMSMRWETQL